MKKRLVLWAALSLLLAGRPDAQEHHHAGAAAAQADLDPATQAMSHGHDEHQHMGPHMHLSTLREPQPGDQEKARAVVEQVRPAVEKYRDSNVALGDGYQIFLPNVPQKMYHFTHYGHAAAAAVTFDPIHPTSLLYEKRGEHYTLIGVMYTAPVRLTEDQLNQRIPLSVGQWHQHVNMCRPPAGHASEMFGPHPRFGLAGSIATQAECDAAGGTFLPHVFGWMVHMYPWEPTPDRIWSVDRQLNDTPARNEHEDHNHDDMAGMEHH